MQYYFPGMAVGIILLQSAIIAPTLIKNLDKEQFKVVIRLLWPKFFLGLVGIGLGTLVTLLLGDATHPVHWGIAAATITFSLICYLMVPATNRARDNGDTARFNLLHKASVFLTLGTLFANMAFLFI